MCDFKPGDEVIYIGPTHIGFAHSDLHRGATYVVEDVLIIDEVLFLDVVGYDWSVTASSFRKVQRRDLNAWLETATDFEEPKRAPAKKERVA